MRPHEKDVLLASADQVAIDAISAKMQGFKIYIGSYYIGFYFIFCYGFGTATPVNRVDHL